MALFNKRKKKLVENVLQISLYINVFKDITKAICFETGKKTLANEKKIILSTTFLALISIYT